MKQMYRSLCLTVLFVVFLSSFGEQYGAVAEGTGHTHSNSKDDVTTTNKNTANNGTAAKGTGHTHSNSKDDETTTYKNTANSDVVNNQYETSTDFPKQSTTGGDGNNKDDFNNGIKAILLSLGSISNKLDKFNGFNSIAKDVKSFKKLVGRNVNLEEILQDLTNTLTDELTELQLVTRNLLNLTENNNFLIELTKILKENDNENYDYETDYYYYQDPTYWK